MFTGYLDTYHGRKRCRNVDMGKFDHVLNNRLKNESEVSFLLGKEALGPNGILGLSHGSTHSFYTSLLAKISVQ